MKRRKITEHLSHTQHLPHYNGESNLHQKCTSLIFIFTTASQKVEFLKILENDEYSNSFLMPSNRSKMLQSEGKLLLGFEIYTLFCIVSGLHFVKYDIQ